MEKLWDQQAVHALPILRDDVECVHLAAYLPHGRAAANGSLSAPLHRLIVCVARLLGLSKHTVRFRGGFRRIFALSAPLQLCTDGFPVQPSKILLRGFRLDYGKLLRYWCGLGRFYWLGEAVIPVAETGAVQPTDDLLDRIVKVFEEVST